jgi:hypothetical protein
LRTLKENTGVFVGGYSLGNDVYLHVNKLLQHTSSVVISPQCHVRPILSERLFTFVKVKL